MNQFFEAFANMFRIADLRKRILFTLGILAVYRLGAFLPTPGINTDVLTQLFQQNQGSVLGIIDLFSGGNFRRLTIFALGIMPYITSSIILQLLTVVVPTLEKLSKEGELGRRKITQWTRYLTVLLAMTRTVTGDSQPPFPVISGEDVGHILVVDVSIFLGGVRFGVGCDGRIAANDNVHSRSFNSVGRGLSGMGLQILQELCFSGSGSSV